MLSLIAYDSEAIAPRIRITFLARQVVRSRSGEAPSLHHACGPKLAHQPTAGEPRRSEWRSCWPGDRLATAKRGAGFRLLYPLVLRFDRLVRETGKHRNLSDQRPGLSQKRGGLPR